MKILFSGPGSAATGALVVGVSEGNTLSPSAKDVDKKTGGALRRAIKSGAFKGKAGQSLSLLSPAGTKLDRILAVGLGKPKDINERAMHKLGGQIYAALKAGGSKSATVVVDGMEKSGLSAAHMAVAIGEGVRLRSYRFDKYQTKKKSNNNGKPALAVMTLRCRGAIKARADFKARGKVVDGVFLTRDLVTEPPNVIYPDTLAKRCRELAKLGVKVEVLGERQMKRLEG